MDAVARGNADKSGIPVLRCLFSSVEHERWLDLSTYSRGIVAIKYSELRIPGQAGP